MPKKESESHNKHRTEQKLCTRAKDNLSKERKRVYIVEEEIVSRFLIKMHPLCRQRCCFPLLLLKCQKRSVLFFSSMCSQETDCSLSLPLSLSYSSSSTISPALTLAVIFINIIITVTTSVVSRTSMISTAVIIIIIILDYNRIFFRYMCVFVLVILFFLRGSECCFGSEDESEEEEKKITNLLTSWKHVTESNLFDICRAVDGRTICI